MTLKLKTKFIYCLVSLLASIWAPQSLKANDENHQLYKLNSALLDRDNKTAKYILETDLKGENDLINRFGEFAACKSLDIASDHASIEVMVLLLKMGVSTECSIWDKSGDTPLMTAYMAKKREMVKFLVQSGADINFTNNFGATIFWVAVVEGDQDYVSFFLEYDPIIDHSGRFPDPLKEISGIVRNLTPLMMASSRGHIEIVKLLLENNSFFGIQDTYGRDARYYAEKSGHEDIVELLDSWEINKGTENP